MRVIITGAGTGIGQATARRLAGEGAQLLLVGRRKFPLQELAEELSVDFATCDVAETGAIEKSSRDFAEKYGGIDGLVANAGINPQRADALHAEDSFWEETLKVNLTGTHRSWIHRGPCGHEGTGRIWIQQSRGRQLHTIFGCGLRGTGHSSKLHMPGVCDYGHQPSLA